MNFYTIYCITAFIFSFVLSFATTPLARMFAYKIKALDIPKDDRRMHKRTIPLLGGLAIFTGFIVSSLLFCGQSRDMLAMCLGGLLIVIVGVIDDRFDMNAMVKFLCQIAVCTFTVLFGEMSLNKMTILGYDIEFGPIWGTVIAVFFMVALINAVNLIDGLDGLACGISAIGALSVLVISAIYSNSYMILFACIIFGSCCGFLPHNFNPAKIFMGDTGAMFLGFILSALSIQASVKMNSFLAFFTPVIVFGLPIIDTAFAFIRRIVHGRSPFSADRGHLHHRLVDMGFSVRQAVCIMYMISGMFGISAILMALRNLDASLEVFTNRRLLLASIGVLCVTLIIFTVSYYLFRDKHKRRHSGLNLPKEDEVKKEENAKDENGGERS